MGIHQWYRILSMLPLTLVLWTAPVLWKYLTANHVSDHVLVACAGGMIAGLFCLAIMLLGAMYELGRDEWYVCRVDAKEWLVIGYQGDDFVKCAPFDRLSREVMRETVFLRIDSPSLTITEEQLGILRLKPFS